MAETDTPKQNHAPVMLNKNKYQLERVMAEETGCIDVWQHKANVVTAGLL